MFENICIDRQTDRQTEQQTDDRSFLVSFRLLAGDQFVSIFRTVTIHLSHFFNCFFPCVISIGVSRSDDL